MAKIDFVGVPIPIDHPKFCNDEKLQKKVKQIESLIELKHDIDEAKEALNALRHSVKKENGKNISLIFKCTPWKISEALLSFIVILYAKAFTESTGRTRLDGQVDEIFGPDIDKHEYTMYFRNGFYAHQGIEANKHQLFCRPNTPLPGKVKLNADGFTTRIVMSLSIDLDKIEFCICRVEKYLGSRIDGLCKNVEENLSKEQVEILIKTPKEELLARHWRNKTGLDINPFTTRET